MDHRLWLTRVSLNLYCFSKNHQSIGSPLLLHVQNDRGQLGPKSDAPKYLTGSEIWAYCILYLSLRHFQRTTATQKWSSKVSGWLTINGPTVLQNDRGQLGPKSDAPKYLTGSEKWAYYILYLSLRHFQRTTGTQKWCSKVSGWLTVNGPTVFCICLSDIAS